MTEYYILRKCGNARSIAVPSEVIEEVYTCEITEDRKIIYTPEKPFKDRK